MNWDRLNQIMQVVSNLGVVVGLVLVATQMNQNTNAMRLQSFQEVTKASTNLEIAAMGDTGYTANAVAMLRPSELTDDQILQHWYYVDTWLGSTFNMWIAYQTGQATESAWIETRRATGGALSTDASQVIWKRFKELGYPKPFIDEMDAEFARGGTRIGDGFKLIVADMRNLDGQRK